MGQRPELIARRTFLLGMSAGLGLGFYSTAALAKARKTTEPTGEAGKKPSSARKASAEGLRPNVFIHVATDGKVTIVCHRSEMGQGVRSSIPVLIADEMGADMAHVEVAQADGDKVYGDQDTDGSNSIRSFYEDLRRVGATAREMLIAAAAKGWKVKPETCEARDHVVRHRPSGRTLGFGELAHAAGKLPVPKPADVTLRPDKELVHVGTELPLLDGEAFVTGTAQFGADIQLPGMLIAVIARPPVVGGKLARMDATKARAIRGVKQLIEIPAPKPPYAFQPWGGVAVLAENTWAAMQGRAALELEWDAGLNGSYDSDAYRETLSAAVAKPGQVLRKTGDVESALEGAAKVIDAEYHVPLLPHVPMEPPVAIARVEGGKCVVWAPSQNPQDARTEAAKVLGIPEDQVTVHVTFLGGGFGRKSNADFVAEAVFLAREAKAPVRVQWTREDDVRHDFYNAVNTQRLTAGLDGSGKVIAWRHRTAYPPIATLFGGPSQPSANDLQQGVLDLALDVPNVQAEAAAAEPHLRIGWLRSVYNIFHGFGINSFCDELAHARGMDPVAFRLELLGPPRHASLEELGIASLRNYGAKLEQHPVDVGRLRHVIERVADLSGWDQRARSGRALGFAAHRSFLSYVAVVASVVERPGGRIAVDEAWVVADAGKLINTDRVRAQMEGSVVFGSSIALFGEISVKEGRVQQSNFRDFRIARIADVPRKIHVELVRSDLPPCGVGEPGVPPVAPAIANAYFALTGKRVRRLPLMPIAPVSSRA